MLRLCIASRSKNVWQMDVNIMTVSGNVYQTTISGCLIHIQTWTSSWTVSAKFYWLHQLDVSFRSMVWPHQANYQVNLHAWHTTDKSWSILSANNVRREKSFVCHRKIGPIFSADKSWPTKNFQTCLKTRQHISGNHMLWLVSAFCLKYPGHGMTQWRSNWLKYMKLIDFYMIHVIRIIRTLINIFPLLDYRCR